MSAPDAPPDNSALVNSQNIAAQKEAQLAADAKAEARRAELAQLRSGAGEAARGSATRYFADQGLDPNQYINDINGRVSEILNSIAPDDPNPGAYFKDIGQDVYNSDETQYRNKQSRVLNQLFPTNFETTKITDDMDDPVIAGILGEQRGSADNIINNMLKRGVITDAGKSAAEADLDRQTFSAQDRLRELGASTLASGRQALTGVANRGRQAASTLNLGQEFDPYSYTTDVDKAFNDFVGNLSGSIRAKVPGSLFNTSSLAAIAGAGQGAQNTKFDPTALAGIIATNQPKKPNEQVTPENIF
jgi:hypothetical protein